MRSRLACAERLSLGTYFFLFVTDDIAVVAIDSRENTSEGHSDTACKISILNDSTIFFSQGVARGIGFRASEIANSVYARQDKPIDFCKMATAWANEMIRSMNAAYQEDADLREALATETTAGFFVGQNGEGSFAGGTAKIELLQPHKLTSSTCSILAGDVIHNGYQEIIDEVDSATSDRAKALLSQSCTTTCNDAATAAARKIHLYVKAVRDWSGDSKIGGDIATIFFERGLKWRWFHEPVCYTKCIGPLSQPRPSLLGLPQVWSCIEADLAKERPPSRGQFRVRLPCSLLYMRLARTGAASIVLVWHSSQ